MKKINIETLKGLTELPETVQVRNYVPMQEKHVVADKFADMIIRQDDADMMYVDHVLERVVKSIGMVALYTNIQIVDDNYVNYDILKENGLLGKIEDLIGEDCAEFYSIIDDIINTKMEVNNSISHIIARTSNDAMMILNRTMKHVDSMIDKGDPNKMAKYLSKGIEMVAAKLPDLSKLDVFQAIDKSKKVN